jgi:hypothetical protein
MPTAPTLANDCGTDFYAGVQWVIDYLDWELAAPQGSSKGAWVRGVSGVWQTERRDEIASNSPWVLVSPGTASTIDSAGSALAMNVPITVSLLVVTSHFRYEQNVHALWVASRTVSKIISLLQNHKPAPQINSTPPREAYPSVPQAFRELKLRRVASSAFPDKDGKPLPGSCVAELDFDMRWNFCLADCECLIPRCQC